MFYGLSAACHNNYLSPSSEGIRECVCEAIGDPNCNKISCSRFSVLNRSVLYQLEKNNTIHATTKKEPCFREDALKSERGLILKKVVTIDGSLYLNQHITTVSVNEDTWKFHLQWKHEEKNHYVLFNFKGIYKLDLFNLALLHAYNYGHRRDSRV